MNQWSKCIISLVTFIVGTQEFFAFGFSFFGLIALLKIEREKTSFQCGTKEFKPKVRQGKAIKPKAKAKEKKFLSTYSYQLHKNKILFSSNSSKYKQK